MWDMGTWDNRETRTEEQKTRSEIKDLKEVLWIQKEFSTLLVTYAMASWIEQQNNKTELNNTMIIQLSEIKGKLTQAHSRIQEATAKRIAQERIDDIQEYIDDMGIY